MKKLYIAIYLILLICSRTNAASKDSIEDIANFSGRVQNNSNMLTWATTTETDDESFTVQRSKNSTDWEDVVNLKGTGGSMWPMSYCWIDTSASEVISFYRIRINKSMGSNFSRSLPVANVPKEEKLTFEIYPNPTKNVIWIKSMIVPDGMSNIEVYTIKGEQVYTTRQRESIQKIDLSDYKRGFYYIKIGSQTYRVFKE